MSCVYICVVKRRPKRATVYGWLAGGWVRGVGGNWSVKRIVMRGDGSNRRAQLIEPFPLKILTDGSA